MRDRLSLAGIEEQAFDALFIGNLRPIVGCQLRQHFGLQGSASRYVRRGVRAQCGRFSSLSRPFHAISLFYRAASRGPLPSG